MRVRWALEEMGQPYEVRLMLFDALKAPGHRALNPFGQIPTWEEGDLTLFESGAIVLHIAQTHPGLLPTEPDARARAIAWIFAAINTVEPPIFEMSIAAIVEADKPWHNARLPLLNDRVRQRLGELEAWLGGRDWLEGRFSVGDLMMITVLRRLGGSSLICEHPSLLEYVARGESRPAFQRAYSAQRAVFEASATRAE